MTKRKVYGMGGKVDLKKLKRDIKRDMKKLEARKKILVKQGRFKPYKTYYNQRIAEYKKILK